MIPKDLVHGYLESQYPGNPKLIMNDRLLGIMELACYYSSLIDPPYAFNRHSENVNADCREGGPEYVDTKATSLIYKSIGEPPRLGDSLGLVRRFLQHSHTSWNSTTHGKYMRNNLLAWTNERLMRWQQIGGHCTSWRFCKRVPFHSSTNSREGQTHPNYTF